VTKLSDKECKLLKETIGFERGLLYVRFVASFTDGVAPLCPESSAPVGFTNSGFGKKSLLSEWHAAIGIGSAFNLVEYVTFVHVVG
jgi:hypothetical protein